MSTLESMDAATSSQVKEKMGAEVSYAEIKAVMMLRKRLAGENP